MPDLESRGLKIALDKHGERVDPDTQSRNGDPGEVDEIRRYVAYRFPALADAPIVERGVRINPLSVLVQRNFSGRGFPGLAFHSIHHSWISHVRQRWRRKIVGLRRPNPK